MRTSVRGPESPLVAAGGMHFERAVQEAENTLLRR